MNTSIKRLRNATLAATVALATLSTATAASGISGQNGTSLLTASFAARQIHQVEVGNFHFKPGQTAPVHTHSAPAVGYVAKGKIIYQIEGGKPQILSAGDAFYEPAGPRILRFDNASATEEAIFLDFNLEQAGEPFIVFEKPLTEEIDRRKLPTISLGGVTVDQVDIRTNELDPSQSLTLKSVQPVLGLVAEGIVEFAIGEGPAKRIIAGKTFALPTPGSQAVVVNTSSEVPATVITFRLN